MGVSYLVRTAPDATCIQVLCISLINVVPGDKSNHVPSFHLPQLYYFIGFATIMGWPALASGDSGWKTLANDVRDRIFGNKRCALIAYAWCEGLSCSSLIRRTVMHVAVSLAMGLSIKLFTCVQVILERTPLTLSSCPGFIIHFYFQTTDITLSMSGGGYSCCTR